MLSNEVQLVARNLASTCEFANPYSCPTGATAHPAPGYVGVLALIYRLSDGGEAATIMALVSSLVAALAYALVLCWVGARGLDSYREPQAACSVRCFRCCPAWRLGDFGTVPGWRFCSWLHSWLLPRCGVRRRCRGRLSAGRSGVSPSCLVRRCCQSWPVSFSICL